LIALAACIFAAPARADDAAPAATTDTLATTAEPAPAAPDSSGSSTTTSDSTAATDTTTSTAEPTPADSTSSTPPAEGSSTSDASTPLPGDGTTSTEPTSSESPTATPAPTTTDTTTDLSASDTSHSAPATTSSSPASDPAPISSPGPTSTTVFNPAPSPIDQPTASPVATSAGPVAAEAVPTVVPTAPLVLEDVASESDLNRPLPPALWFLPPAEFAHALAEARSKLGSAAALRLLRPALPALLLRRDLILPLLNDRTTRAFLLAGVAPLLRGATRHSRPDAENRPGTRGSMPLPQLPPNLPQPNAPTGLGSSSGGAPPPLLVGAFAILLAAFGLMRPRPGRVMRSVTTGCHSLAFVSPTERPG
jgi:hypothetical protein